MSGLASALGSGFSQLFKAGRKYIGNKVDNFLLDAEARKAINDEVVKKFQPMIEKARRAESKRADNIKDLGDKLNESKDNWQKAQDKWKQDYDSALAGAKAQRQKDIDAYNAQLQGYQTALDTAKQGKRSIMNQLNQQEATYTPTKTIFTDVNTGDRYLVHPVTGEYKNITQIFRNASQDLQRRIARYIKGFDERLVDNSSGTPKVINAFNKTTFKSYHGKNNIFDAYIDRVGAPKRVDLIDANNQIKQADSDLTTWKNNLNKPTAWDETTQGNNDLTRFESDFTSKNGSLPTEYSFNGQTYSKEADLNKAYKEAVAREQKMQARDSGIASRYTSKQDAEIARRIQDAKDVKKAKLALGAGVGAGALYAGARAMYGGDDTDNSETPDNIDTTVDAYTGEPDINIKNTPDGKDADSNPDEAAAVLASGAYDQGAEDGNSIEL